MKPFDRGIEERKAGKDLQHCPFPEGSAEYDEWRRGWLIASTSGRFTRTDRKQPPKPG
jgi:hypothetical protein